MAHLNPYLNFHRPCGFATVSLDARGKRKREYKREDYATPYEKLKSLPEAEKYLKEKMSFARLDAAAPEVERYGMRAEDDGGQGSVVAAVQDGIAGCAGDGVRRGKGYGNDGPVESVEIQRRDSPSFHRPLEISQEARDFHIPTAPAVDPGKTQNRGTQKKCGRWKSGNPKAGFPLSHSPYSLRRKEEKHSEKTGKFKRRSPGTETYGGTRFQAHLVLESNLPFRLILRLENAAVTMAIHDPALTPLAGPFDVLRDRPAVRLSADRGAAAR